MGIVEKSNCTQWSEKYNPLFVLKIINAERMKKMWLWINIITLAEADSHIQNALQVMDVQNKQEMVHFWVLLNNLFFYYIYCELNMDDLENNNKNVSFFFNTNYI